MGKSFFLLFSLLYFVGAATATATTTRVDPPSAATNFIKTSCITTRYPTLCINSLTAYALTIQQSPHQLAQTALTVSLTKAESIKTTISTMMEWKGMKKREYEAFKNCLNEMGDSVDRLSKSIKEMRQIGPAHGDDFLFHMSNIETWVSSALTDDTTCLDGFVGQSMRGKAKATFRARIVNMAQITSNALALINQFAKMS